MREINLLGVTIGNKLTFVKRAKAVKESINALFKILRTLSGRSFEAFRCILAKIARVLII